MGELFFHHMDATINYSINSTFIRSSTPNPSFVIAIMSRVKPSLGQMPSSSISKQYAFPSDLSCWLPWSWAFKSSQAWECGSTSVGVTRAAQFWSHTQDMEFLIWAGDSKEQHCSATLTHQLPNISCILMSISCKYHLYYALKRTHHKNFFNSMPSNKSRF